jgi:MYXO-CTERM domain-containing protein
MVDDGDNLCAAGEVCAQGVCRHKCDDSEFPCSVGLKCDSSDGLCKDPGCIGMTCGTGQVCQRGVCVGGCDGVTCPHGQSCRLGRCVAPCDGVTCPTDRVCENGACQPLCNNKCRSCKAGTTCNMTSGVCVETGCESKNCPAGQVCVAGNCQDGCTGVTCPGGQECMMGACTPVSPPDAGTPAGTGGGGGFVILGTGGQGGTVGTGGIVSVGTAGHTSTGGGGGTLPQRGSIQTCNCEVARGPRAGGIALLLIGLAIAAGRRRK